MKKRIAGDPLLVRRAAEAAVELLNALVAVADGMEPVARAAFIETVRDGSWFKVCRMESIRRGQDHLAGMPEAEAAFRECFQTMAATWEGKPINLAVRLVPNPVGVN